MDGAPPPGSDLNRSAGATASLEIFVLCAKVSDTEGAMSPLQKVPAAIVIVVALTGCDAARNIGRSPEERINEARPVQLETLQARKALEQ